MSSSFPAAPHPGQAAGRFTGVCSLPPPRGALSLPGRCLDGAALAAVDLQLISIFTLL